MYCECGDYEQPEFLTESKPVARKEHSCCECGNTIKVGERYERHSGKWDGRMETFCWCFRCSGLAAYIRAHVPCFCWTYTSLQEDALGCAEYPGEVTPGLWFGAARFVVQARIDKRNPPNAN